MSGERFHQPVVITLDTIRAILRPYEADDTIEAWLHGMHDYLGDRSPIEVIESDPAAVWEDAMNFIAYG